jgi:FkbM family methyltransferase
MEGVIHKAAAGLNLGLKAVAPGPAAGRQMARRRLRFRLLQLLRREISFQRNGFMWSGLTSCSITQEIFINDHYQDADLDQLMGRLKVHTDFTRPVIVNVGANLGDVVLPLTRTGKRIIAVEPNPETFARLEHNVRQNGLQERVTCCPCAIAEQEGTVELVMARDPGNSELNDRQGRLGFEGRDVRQKSVAVKTIRLDGLLGSLGITPAEVALVWSDTQGFEAQVIASGTALWEKGTPVWVEIWPKGLACHGGTGQFLELCQRHFRRFLPASELTGEPQPVSELGALVAKLKESEFTDVLLIP